MKIRLDIADLVHICLSWGGGVNTKHLFQKMDHSMAEKTENKKKTNKWVKSRENSFQKRVYPIVPYPVETLITF